MNMADEVWEAHKAVLPGVDDSERERRLTLILNELWDRGLVLVPSTSLVANRLTLLLAGVAIGMIIMLGIAWAYPGEII